MTVIKRHMSQFGTAFSEAICLVMEPDDVRLINFDKPWEGLQ
tara:strand:- start:574 stop:699 length:126 start_codon:yes stop_codon:yes gene_type:complete